jgi:hypothetical protein
MGQLILKAPKRASVYFGGNANVAQQFPLWGKGNVVRYWAERGLVHWEDSKDGAYGSMFWQEASLRVIGLSDMVNNSRDEGLYSDEIYKTQKFICEMEKVIRQAKEQGGPLDGQSTINDVNRRRRTIHLMKQPPRATVAHDSLEFKPARPARRDPHAKKSKAS